MSDTDSSADEEKRGFGKLGEILDGDGDGDGESSAVGFEDLDDLDDLHGVINQDAEE